MYCECIALIEPTARHDSLLATMRTAGSTKTTYTNLLNRPVIIQQVVGMIKIYCIASSAQIQKLKNQIKPAKLNNWPSRDRHRNGKNPRKPLRCVF
jgi:hypothetical protein